MSRIVAAVAAVFVLNASAEPYRQIHRVFCTRTEAIEAARTNWPNAFGTGLIISAFSQIRGKRQLGLYPNRLPDPWLKKGKVEKLIELCDPGEERWRNLIYLGIPISFRLADAAVVVENRWTDPKVRRKGAKTGEPLAAEWLKALSWAGGEAVKDQLDRIAGGRMPSRADSAVRVGQSVWESPDGTERTVFVYNFDFDDADDVRLTEDGTFTAEALEADGSWTPLGTGDVFAVATVSAWSAKVLRLRRNANQAKGK